MSVWTGMRSLFGRARAGATGVAHGASVRLDVRNLEGRRDHLFRSIGRRVLALHGEGRGIPEFTSVCEQLADVERSIAQKRAELAQSRARPEPEAETEAAAPPA